MDKQQLQAIEERWAKPLQEKWRHVARARGNIETESGRGIASCHVYASNVTSEDYITENLANADRIIAAPTDIADLIAEVIRLQEENSKYKDAWILQEVRAGNFKEEAAGNG